jgi:thiol:disulfide interchange protein DsbD
VRHVRAYRITGKMLTVRNSPERRSRITRWLGGAALLMLLVLIVTWAWPVLAGTAPEGGIEKGLETALGERLQQALTRSGGGFLFAYLLAFAAGVGTSLTPCVYPLIPITVSLFGARDAQVNRFQAMGLAACYVGGIATMYTALGVVVGLVGGKFGSLMVSPFLIVPVAVFFLTMAASMFGAFELALPTEMQGRLSRVGGKGKLGAYLMGLVAGLIAAPCTGPPLLALLVFVSTQRSVFLGGSLLFVYAMGIGVLFFIIAGFALRMPKSGAWMDAVKSAFGVILIVAALYFLRNIVTPLRDYGRGTGGFLLVHAVLAAVGVLVGGLRLGFSGGAAMAARKSLGVVLLTVGLFGGIAWLLAPKPTAAGAPSLSWMTDEAQALARAKAEHKPLLVDFGAEWCPPCKQMELKTFVEPKVAAELSRFVLLRIDCTKPTPQNEALQAKYDSETLPSVVIFDSGGQRVLQLREFTPPDMLLPVLQRTR